MMYALWIDADQRFAYSLSPAPGAVEISEEHHALMMDAQSVGMVITRDEGGRPLAIDRPPPSLAELMAALRIERDRRLADSDKAVLPDRWESYTTAQKAAWSAYRQDLRDLPELTTNPANPVWPVEPATA